MLHCCVYNGADRLCCSRRDLPLHFFTLDLVDSELSHAGDRNSRLLVPCIIADIVLCMRAALAERVGGNECGFECAVA